MYCIFHCPNICSLYECDSVCICFLWWFISSFFFQIVSSFKLTSVNYFWSRFRACFSRKKMHLLLPRTNGHYLPRTTWHWIFTWPHKNNWILMPKLSKGQIVVRKIPTHYYHHILLRLKAKKGKSTHFCGDEVNSPPSLIFPVYHSMRTLPFGSGFLVLILLPSLIRSCALSYVLHIWCHFK